MNRRSLVRYLLFTGLIVVSVYLLVSSVKMGKFQTDPTLEPHTATSVNQSKKEKAVNPVPLKLKVGEKYEVKQNGPYFTEPLSIDSSLDKLIVRSSVKKGDFINVHTTDTELVSVNTSEQGVLWLPSWYLSNAAGEVNMTSPIYVSIQSKAELHLAPESEMLWPEAENVKQRVSIAKWKNWYGVIVSQPNWHEGYNVQQPFLLWVHERDIAGHKAIQGGLLDRNSEVPTDVVRNIAGIQLAAGVDDLFVKQLLGKPHFIETSANLEMTGTPMRLGVTWRYEREDSQFLVTFSSAGKLERYNWQLPAYGEKAVSTYMGDNFNFTYDIKNTPLASTLMLSPVWRHQGDLNFTFLLGGNDDVLLLRGDDGGFSGMHYDSCLYAINRHTGKKLWQVDAGFGWFFAEMDQSRQYVTIYTAYNPDLKKYDYRIQHIRLSDGHVIWEVNLAENAGWSSMLAARDVILIYHPWDQDKKEGSVVVYDSATGKERWKKTFTDEYRVLNEGAEDAHILIQQKQQLEAYDPPTGQLKWTLKGASAEPIDPYSIYDNGYRAQPFVPASSKRWLLAGSEWLLLDTETGDVSVKYSVARGERVDIIDERYMLVQRGLDTDLSGNATRYETSLQDLKEERTLWTIKGRVFRGVIEGDVMYAAVEGIPTAIDMESGSSLWKMKTTANKEDYLLYLSGSSYAVTDEYLILYYGSDLLVLGKNDGKVIGRVHDMLGGMADLRESEARTGLMNTVGDELYVGTSNGAFSRFNLESLKP
ncbi:outer membrane protein assembly factor BamB family protein [Paenibacillus marinisediminis]